MATYALGDVQGCYDELLALTDRLGFDPRRDRLWLAGDLVNRGDRSLEVLRWVRHHERAVRVVLGNHDVHLIALADGVHRKSRALLDTVLHAPDGAELVGWLRRRPLVHVEHDRVLVHAGLLPDWNAATARARAAEVEATIAGGGPDLKAIYPGARGRWDPEPEDPLARQALALSAFTLLRTLRPDGTLCTGFSGPPSAAPAGCVPWYELRGDRHADEVVFGHWAALGYHRGPGYLGLDTGCVWGGRLTAVRLDDGERISVPCRRRKQGSQSGA